jgi:hypothetical protein
MTERGRTLPSTCKPSSKIDAPTAVGKVRPLLTVVPGVDDADGPCRAGSSLIDEIVRDGARRMLAEALRAEVDAYIAQFTGDRDEHGRRLVVCNGSTNSIGRLSSCHLENFERGISLSRWDRLENSAEKNL